MSKILLNGTTALLAASGLLTALQSCGPAAFGLGVANTIGIQQLQDELHRVKPETIEDFSQFCGVSFDGSCVDGPIVSCGERGGQLRMHNGVYGLLFFGESGAKDHVRFGIGTVNRDAPDAEIVERRRFRGYERVVVRIDRALLELVKEKPLRVHVFDDREFTILTPVDPEYKGGAPGFNLSYTPEYVQGFLKACDSSSTDPNRPRLPVSYIRLYQDEVSLLALRHYVQWR